MFSRFQKRWLWRFPPMILIFGGTCLSASSIEGRLKQLPTTPLFAGEVVRSPVEVGTFYQSRKFSPAWFEENEPTANARQLVRELTESVPSHGLRFEDYHLATLLKALQSSGRNDTADLDILFSDAFLTYASHLTVGRLSPDQIQENWMARTHPRSLAGFLGIALATRDMVQSLRSLAPQSKGYELLREGLEKYREIAKAGEWPQVPGTKKIKPGEKSRRVALLRARLERENATLYAADDPMIYDEILQTGVRDFQAHHGLNPDGVVGATTLAELNVSLRARIQQIEVNLERWRWLPRNLGDEYLFVDIANFRADYFVNGRSRLQMKIVAGKKERMTPVFSDEITHIVVNPSWSVPPTIVREDLLPHLKDDPDFIKKKGITVYERAGRAGLGPPVDENSIPWDLIAEPTRHYVFRQPPGPTNPLGSLKFGMRNALGIYLHGTSDPSLFGRELRTFSSGCIRLEKPLVLASLLIMGDDSDSSTKIILNEIKKGEEATFKLPHPIPVHLFYWTAWIDDSMRLQFRRDVYGWDENVRLGLNGSTIPTTPTAVAR